MQFRTPPVIAAVLLAIYASTVLGHAADDPQSGIKQGVDEAIRPMMAKYGIPGMAVGVIVEGTAYVFNYGVASTATRHLVTDQTLFEIGSVSKTFTATLVSYAQIGDQLSLSDRTSKYLPSLRGSEFGEMSLLNLGTHTTGGLPLQVPESVRNDAELLQYFKDWAPAFAAGTHRTYANAGIGTLGLITAKSMGRDFTALMELRLFPALGMKSSFIDVPEHKAVDYAQGYTEQGAPIRMSAGVLSAEAYGIKSTATDLIRFVKINMRLAAVAPKLQRAITETHTGYFQAGVMTQDLIWEQYPYPVPLKTLLEGNAPAMLYDATPVTEIVPPRQPREDVWINKTGSTNGFGAYVAFVPQKRLGIVILANKSYPIADRVTMAYEIMERLASQDAYTTPRRTRPTS